MEREIVTKNSLEPYLIITAPDGEQQTVPLTGDRLTFGRDASQNDIELSEPDPNAKKFLISRKHCFLEKKEGNWFVTDGYRDNASTNGTLLQQGNQKIELQQQDNRTSHIKHEDIVIVHGWEIRFLDPWKTDQVKKRPNLEIENRKFIYHANRETLCYVTEGGECSIHLRPQVASFLNYMIRKNNENGGQPTLCTYEDLEKAIWEYPVTRNDLNRLARELRDAVEQAGADRNQILETIKKRGYVLNLDC